MLHRRSGGRSEDGDSVPVLAGTAYILRDEDTCSSNSRYRASEDRDLHEWQQRSARYLATSGPLPNLRATPLKLPLEFWSTVRDEDVQRPEIPDPGLHHGSPGVLGPSRVPRNHLEVGPVANDIEVADNFGEKRDEERVHGHNPIELERPRNGDSPVLGSSLLGIASVASEVVPDPLKNLWPRLGRSQNL
eukprot:4800232-Pyramimonas_sp.AAC.1